MPGAYLDIRIIIHYMIILLYYLMNNWVGQSLLGPDHLSVRFIEYVHVNGWI